MPLKHLIFGMILIAKQNPKVMHVLPSKKVDENAVEKNYTYLIHFFYALEILTTIIEIFQF